MKLFFPFITVLCADEPTSGLDGFTALVVIQSLKAVTVTRGMVIIASIHQPRAEVFQLFDKLILLTLGGHCIFAGNTEDMIPHFASLECECPKNANPADFYMDLSNFEGTEEDKRRLRLLINKCKSDRSFEDNFGRDVNVEGSLSPECTMLMEATGLVRTSWLAQVWILLRRFSLVRIRTYSTIQGDLVHAVMVSFIIASCFWQLDVNSIQGIISVTALLYMAFANFLYDVMVKLLYLINIEVKLLDLERMDHLYHPTAFVIAHIISVIPLLSVQAVIYFLPIYFGTGINSGFEHFLIMLAVILLVLYCGLAYVWMVTSINRNFRQQNL